MTVARRCASEMSAPLELPGAWGSLELFDRGPEKEPEAPMMNSASAPAAIDALRIRGRSGRLLQFRCEDGA
jgi:hypothetical protein